MKKENIKLYIKIVCIHLLLSVSGIKLSLPVSYLMFSKNQIHIVLIQGLHNLVVFVYLFLIQCVLVLESTPNQTVV